MEGLRSVSEELLSNLRTRYKSGGLAPWFPFTTVPLQDVQKIVTEYLCYLLSIQHGCWLT